MAISQAELLRRMREAQRKAQQQVKREVDRINRENKRQVDAHNREVSAHNRKVEAQISAYNQRVETQNRRAAQHNAKLISDLNRSLRSSTALLQYTESEKRLADRVHQAIAFGDPRDYDTFLSYARIDGAKWRRNYRPVWRNLGWLFGLMR